MDERRFYRKPWFYLFFWSVICGGVYIWQIRSLGGFSLNLVYIFMDGIVFTLGLLFWLAFFAQFVLPVKTTRERQKIFDRLLSYLTGGHGPAIFIENGRPRARFGEAKKKGPGVLWLDSASAAVTRLAAVYKQTIGPGVHFTESGERIAGTVDLHAQKQTLGPREIEEPFAPKKDDQSEAEHEQIQKRRTEVSAWTRDGIEVVPNISVLFKIDAPPATGTEPGSRFGFEKSAVEKAIRSEGINPDAPEDVPRRRVAWNQLPALIAVDLWREYLARFTLGELFHASQPGPMPTTSPPEPTPEETRALLHPVTLSRNKIEKTVADMLHELNLILARWADRCEGKHQKTTQAQQPSPSASSQNDRNEEVPKETALKTINRMVKARMTEMEVDILDDNGNPVQGKHPSPEYKLLQQRGLKIISVNIGKLRFNPDIEEQLVRQWNTSWLENARSERDRIERQRGYVELDEQTNAAQDYAESLSRNLLKENPGTNNPKETLKTLLLRSRDELINKDRLHRRASMEREELEEIVQWVERNGS